MNLTINLGRLRQLSLKRLAVTVYIASIFVGFTINFSVPTNVRILALGVVVFGTILILIFDVLRNRDLFSYCCLVFLPIFMLASITFGTEPIETQIETLAIYVSVILGFFLSKFYDTVRRVLVYVVFLNFIILLGDVFSGAYIISPELGYKYEADRGRGLFSYSKECGSFVLFSALVFRNNFKILFLLLASAVLTGSRAPMLFISSILLIEYIFYDEKFRTKSIFSVFFVMFFSFYFASLYFSLNSSMLGRILGSFDFATGGTHAFRFEIWNAYISELRKYDVVHFIFGNPFALHRILGNGAENQFLDLLSNGGLVMLFVGVSPILFLATASIIKFSDYYPFILVLIVMLFARYGSGWSDGVILWFVVFHIFKTRSVQLNYSGGQSLMNSRTE